VDNIKMYLRETGWGGMGWIYRDLWGAFMNTTMNLQVPQKVGKLVSSCVAAKMGCFSRRAELHGIS
jgi:hypothetical protein